MKKLIAKYLANPSVANAERIVDHNWKHPMSTLMLADDEFQTFKTAMAQYNTYCEQNPPPVLKMRDVMANGWK